MLFAIYFIPRLFWGQSIRELIMKIVIRFGGALHKFISLPRLRERNISYVAVVWVTMSPFSSGEQLMKLPSSIVPSFGMVLYS